MPFFTALLSPNKLSIETAFAYCISWIKYHTNYIMFTMHSQQCHVVPSFQVPWGCFQPFFSSSWKLWQNVVSFNGENFSDDDRDYQIERKATLLMVLRKINLLITLQISCCVGPYERGNTLNLLGIVQKLLVFFFTKSKHWKQTKMAFG